MVVSGNLLKVGHTVEDSIYKQLSAVLVRGLRTVHDLDSVIYFESDVDITQRELRGLANMATAQMIHPFSEIQRPKSMLTYISDERLQNIIATCVEPVASGVQS